MRACSVRQCVAVWVVVALVVGYKVLLDPSISLTLKHYGMQPRLLLFPWRELSALVSPAQPTPSSTAATIPASIHNVSSTAAWQRSAGRLADVAVACRTLNISTSVNSVVLNHLHVDEQRGFLYCYIPKVACTSWKRIWMKITGLLEDDEDFTNIMRYRVHKDIPRLDDQRYDTTRANILRTYKKFVFVRHPFDRALSAYRDKLEHLDSESSYDFHEKVGKLIERKLNLEDTEGHNVSFSDFIRWVSSDIQSVEAHNEHWTSMHELCAPCALNYHFLGKYETLQQDADAVLEWMQACPLVPKFPAADRPFHAAPHRLHYHRLLTTIIHKEFLARFKADFLAFDYQQLPDN